MVNDQQVALDVVMDEADNIDIDIQNTCTSLHEAWVRHKRDAHDLRGDGPSVGRGAGFNSITCVVGFVYKRLHQCIGMQD